MKKTRVYPLRTSSDEWRIKIFSKHVCNNKCKFSYIEQIYDRNSSIMFIINNPSYKDGKCQYSSLITPSYIDFNSFDINLPKTIDGDLLYENNIVIPDNKIYILFDFPLKKPKKIIVKSNNNLGFSLLELLNKIKNIYKWIYTEEEKTSSVKNHLIKNYCDCKINHDFLLNDIKDIKDIKDINENCGVCLEKLDVSNLSKKTNCSHFFHKDCILKWLKIGKNSCPICRKNLYTCKKCIDGISYLYYKGKVVPKEIRGIDTNRNQTDGIFNIYDYDMEDILLEDMYYNKKTKILKLNVFV
jgi:hypothetical protein